MIDKAVCFFCLQLCHVILYHCRGIRHPRFAREIHFHEFPEGVAVIDCVLYSLAEKGKPVSWQIHPQHRSCATWEPPALSVQIGVLNERRPFVPWDGSSIIQKIVPLSPELPVGRILLSAKRCCFVIYFSWLRFLLFYHYLRGH